MAVRNLAEALAEDIADVGLAELVAPGSLKATESDTLVELEQESDLIRIYEGGEQIAEYSTSDEKFNEKLMATLATSLNF